MKTIAVLLCFLATVLCQADPPAITDSVTLSNNVIVPEGIEWVSGIGFLVGSIANGAVYTVLDDGTTTALTTPTNFIDGGGALGLEYNVADDLLFVVNSRFPPNATEPFQGGIGTFNSDGTEVNYYDMTNVASGGIVFNDVAYDSDNEAAYVTISNQPLIASLDLSGSIGIPDVWSQSDLYNSTMIPGLNGIAHYPGDNFLLTCNAETGVLIKVTYASPNSPTVVTGVDIEGCDGIYFGAGGDALFIARNGAFNQVDWVRTEDDWATATLVESVDITAGTPVTTVVRVNDEVFVLTAGDFTPGTAGTITNVAFTPDSSSSPSSDTESGSCGLSSFLF